MSIQDVPLNLLIDWMNAFVPNEGIIVGAPSFVNLTILNDVDKLANLEAYLNDRVTRNQVSVSALPQYVLDQTQILNADITACTAALAMLP